jgi:hypothetical protein
MRQINPMAKACANAEKTQRSRDRGKALWKKQMAKGKEFIDGTHRYERSFSDVRTGEMRVMGGREAKALNEKLFGDYLAAVGANVEGRSLERWKVVERFVDMSKG